MLDAELQKRGEAAHGDDTGTALGVRMTPSELRLLLLSQRGTSNEVYVKVLQTKVSKELSSGIMET